MGIFESLENLNVSEGCFEDIVGLVEEYINEYDPDTFPGIARGRRKQVDKKTKTLKKELKGLKKDEEKALYYANKAVDNAERKGNSPEDKEFFQKIADRKYFKLKNAEDKTNNKRAEILDNMRHSNELKNLTAQFKGNPNRWVLTR